MQLKPEGIYSPRPGRVVIGERLYTTSQAMQLGLAIRAAIAASLAPPDQDVPTIYRLLACSQGPLRVNSLAARMLGTIQYECTSQH